MTPRLFERPNWVCLLREYEALYRHGSNGGSVAIRSQRKRVRETLSAVIEVNPELVLPAPETKPVVAHFARALDLGTSGVMSGFSRAVTLVGGGLAWA